MDNSRLSGRWIFERTRDNIPTDRNSERKSRSEIWRIHQSTLTQSMRFKFRTRRAIMKMLVTAPLKLVVQGLVVMALALPDPTLAAAAAKSKTRQIAINYATPKNPDHEPGAALLRERRFLEKVQEILSPFRLPRTLNLVIEGCDGNANARYDGSGITFCYEFIAEVWNNAPTEMTPEGVTRTDAIVGALF